MAAARAAVGSRMRREQSQRAIQLSSQRNSWMKRDGRSGDFILLSDSSTNESFLTHDNHAISPSIYTLSTDRSNYAQRNGRPPWGHMRAEAYTDARTRNTYHADAQRSVGFSGVSHQNFDQVYQPTTARIDTHSPGTRAQPSETPPNALQILQVQCTQ